LLLATSQLIYKINHMNPSTLRILNLIGFIYVITMNTLANALPLNGKTTGELSALYPNSFVPAGFTFSIWGVIYLFLLGFIIFQFTKQATEEVKKIGPWFFISCLANGTWIVAWHYEIIVLSLLIMILLLVSLLMIYLRLNIALEKVSAAKRWLIQAPFSLYLGWITVATIANTTALLVDVGWTGGGIPEPTWAGIMVLIAGLIGSSVILRRKDVFYGLVLLWAFWGIWNGQQPLAGFLQTSLIIAGIAVVIDIVLVLIKRS
jgi:hypothetical protein